VRVLVDAVSGRTPGGPGFKEAVLDDSALAEAYAVPSTPWLRVNMVASLDGAATGADGRTGSINNPADKRVFDHLRATADAIVVGAGTARVEGYGPDRVPIVVVSRSGQVPAGLSQAPAGLVLLGTTALAPGLAEARELLGDEQVLVTGQAHVDLAVLLDQLHRRGLNNLLSEGGPSLLRDLLAAGLVDELCLTTVPRVVAGSHLRITTGGPVDVPMRLGLLLEEDGTLIARWFVER
jgi:riboflavin biosynthesis pyrimidine reductase